MTSTSQDSTGSLEVVNEQGLTRRVDVEAVRQNGWTLHRASPEARRRLSLRMKERHAEAVVILLRHWQPSECIKFLVERSLTLGHLKTNVAQSFQLTQSFHVVFDGVSFPDANAIGDIFAWQARDDGVLHGFLVPLDAAQQIAVENCQL